MRWIFAPLLVVVVGCSASVGVNVLNGGEGEKKKPEPAASAPAPAPAPAAVSTAASSGESAIDPTATLTTTTKTTTTESTSATATATITATATDTAQNPGSPQSPAPPSPPADPTNVTASPRSATVMSLAWQWTGASAIEFQIAYATPTAPADCDSGAVIPHATVGHALTYDVTGLTAGTTYGFRVCAVDSGAPTVRSAGATMSGDAPARGALDVGFGGSGYVLTNVGAGTPNMANRVRVQADGKIVVAGQAHNGTNYDIQLVRYLPSGSLDTSFGTNGLVRTTAGFGSTVTMGLGIDSQGRIVVAQNNSSGAITVYRYLADGTLDTSFNGTGILPAPIVNNGNLARNLRIGANDNILVAGATDTPYQFHISRILANGTLDTNFDADGAVTTGFGGRATAMSILEQSDGKIVAVGQNNNGNFFYLARYNLNGSLDNTFGTSGQVQTQFGVGKGLAKGSALQADGKIVAAGVYDNGGHNDIAVARYNTDGSLDGSFGTGGKVELPTSFATVALEVEIDANGKLVLGGYGSDGAANRFLAVRLNSDGTLDTSFGNGGKVLVPLVAGHLENQGRAMALQPDGKILLTGYYIDGTTAQFMTARLWP